MRYNHFDLLPERAFRKLGRKLLSLEGGGKGSSPPAPDYAGAAQATAQGNLEATRAASAANRINQYTPYGNLTYSHNPTSTFDQQAYDSAMQKYQQDLAAYNNGGAATPGILGAMRVTGGGSNGQAPTAPDKNSFYTSNPDEGWAQTVSLSPVGQQLLDYSNSSALGLGEQTDQALQRVDQTLAQPFDYSSVGDTQDAAYKAFTSRLDPQWQTATAQQETQLANQGIPVGSEAYDNAMRSFNNAKNDAYSQASLNAINTAPQTYQLAQALRSQPLNELNALRTGSQVQNPTFSSVPQQQTTTGPNYLAAAQSQGQWDMNNYNQEQAASSNMTSGLMQAGAMAAMYF